MGVLNATPDSFSDGGIYAEPARAIARIDELLEAGADMIDIGGESTRPGAKSVAAEEQIARIRAPLIHAAQERRALVSVDTASAEVAGFAVARGARIVNDTSCLADAALARVAREARAALILMHARGSMTRMPGFSQAPANAYDDVVDDVCREWGAARSRAEGEGLDSRDILFDPGLGFMKNAAHSIELIRRLRDFERLGAPIVVGPSRKSFLDKISPAEAHDRLGGTIAACLACADRGVAILRVHDVFAVKQALRVHVALRKEAPGRSDA
jgi:dihydropteroate synthase